MTQVIDVVLVKEESGHVGRVVALNPCYFIRACNVAFRAVEFDSKDDLLLVTRTTDHKAVLRDGTGNYIVG